MLAVVKWSAEKAQEKLAALLAAKEAGKELTHKERKAARKEYGKAWYDKNREHKLKTNSEWASQNKDLRRGHKKKWLANKPEYHKTTMKKWRDENPNHYQEYQRRYGLKYNYGLTVEEYDAMLTAQGGKCKICGTDDPGNKGKRWSVDHLHGTDYVRGLLCHCCNLMIGQAKENTKTLLAAVDYLQHHALARNE